jgi:hypothetical protein
MGDVVNFAGRANGLCRSAGDPQVERLLEIRVIPREAKWNLVVGSFWFETERAFLVRASTTDAQLGALGPSAGPAGDNLLLGILRKLDKMEEDRAGILREFARRIENDRDAEFEAALAQIASIFVSEIEGSFGDIAAAELRFASSSSSSSSPASARAQLDKQVEVRMRQAATSRGGAKPPIKTTPETRRGRLEYPDHPTL